MKTTIKSILRKDLETQYNITLQFHPKYSKSIRITFDFNNTFFTVDTNTPVKDSISTLITEEQEKTHSIERDRISTSSSTPPAMQRPTISTLTIQKKKKESFFQHLFSCMNTVKKKQRKAKNS
mgnify:CR=1 FL=1